MLAQQIPNDSEEMKKIFTSIFSIVCDDALRYDLDTLEVVNITEFKEYHGVKVTIFAYLDTLFIAFEVETCTKCSIFTHAFNFDLSFIYSSILKNSFVWFLYFK